VRARTRFADPWDKAMVRSREAAKDCSPRRKAWVQAENNPSPKGAKEKVLTHIP